MGTSFQLSGHAIQESARGQNYDRSVSRFRKIPAVAGDQNRAAGRRGREMDFIVRVAKDERRIRRLEHSGDPLEFPDGGREAVAVRRVSGSFRYPHILIDNGPQEYDLVIAYRPDDGFGTGSSGSGRRNKNVAVNDAPDVSRA